MHSAAPPAARAGREALAQKGERALWAMNDLLVAHQEHLKRDDLDGYAHGLGLDMGKWKAALDGDAHQGQIDADKEAAEGMAQAYSKFRKLIQRTLAEAK